MSKLQVHNQIHFVINVTPAKENWNIVVRVIRLWFVTDLAKSKISFSMELILQDKEVIQHWLTVLCSVTYFFFITLILTSFFFCYNDLCCIVFQGVRIHGSIRRTLIYKFQSQIFYGSVYSVQSFSVASNSGSYKTTHHPYKINFQFGTR